MRPIMLGIVGDSASGKTTLSKGIARIMGEDRVTVICTDNYHRYDRQQRKEKNISALHPDCNYLSIMEQHLQLLRKGEPILSPVYNHSTGTFDPPVYIEPTNIMIIEGLLGFYTHTMRDQFDVKVYLDPPEELRAIWKINRDTSKRGYTVEEVMLALKKREYDSEHFIRMQKKFADILVQFYPKSVKTMNGQLNVKLLLRSTLAHPDLNEVVDRNGERGKSSINLHVGRFHDRLTEFLDVSNTIESEKVKKVKEILTHYLPDLKNLATNEMGIYTKGSEKVHSDTLAIAQMLVVYHLLMTEHILKARQSETKLYN